MSRRTRETMKHTLVALMQDRPAVLHRVVSLFRRRGYNIESLAVGQSETVGVSRMSLVVDAENVEQVVKQLSRLVEVLKVTDVTSSRTVERETALVKVSAQCLQRRDVVATANACGAKILDVASSSIVIEITGDPDEVERFIEAMRPFGLREMMRTGRIAMTRGTANDSRQAIAGKAARVAAMSPRTLAPNT